mgnify:CR=1 FL=1
MIKATCTEKIRGKYNRIEAYVLQDTQGNMLRTTPDQLKMAIFSKQVEIDNLKLTSDGRLIDKEPTDNIKFSTEEEKFKRYTDSMISMIATEINKEAKYIQNLEVDAEGDHLRCFKGIVTCPNGDKGEININFFKTKIHIYIEPLKENRSTSSIEQANKILISCDDITSAFAEIRLAIAKLKGSIKSNNLWDEGTLLIRNKNIIIN